MTPHPIRRPNTPRPVVSAPALERPYVSTAMYAALYIGRQVKYTPPWPELSYGIEYGWVTGTSKNMVLVRYESGDVHPTHPANLEVVLQ